MLPVEMAATSLSSLAGTYKLFVQHAYREIADAHRLKLEVGSKRSDQGSTQLCRN